MSDSRELDPKDNLPDSTEELNKLFLVGIGASAGGLSALEELFAHLPADTGAAFVVIQHLSPDFKSLMKELLQRHTDMAVHRVTEGMELQPNSVYLIPPGKNLTVEANLLRLEERKKDKNDKHELNFPIDLFFTSLAKNYGERSIGVILSGSGSDGTHGLRAINEAGGIALVQDPETADFDGIPRSAIATGVVNQILPPQELAQLIYQCVVSPLNLLEAESNENSLLTHSSLKTITNFLLETENIDFSHYKTSTMSRRIHRRRLINNFDDIAQYIEFLRNSTEERKILGSDLLINVTHFFRDTAAWESLENNILPILIKQTKPNEEELRFWVAGCSTGEEAYSLAILVHEALENLDQPLTVKIFATDIDRTALEKASAGIYPQSIVNHITPKRLQKYFIPKDNHYQVIRKLREMLIFSPHDLTKDTGFTRIHLISCRNVLIYMQSDWQQQIIRNFHYSLVAKGMLFLGEAESVGIFESEFNPVDKKWKIYQKRRDIRLPFPFKTVPRLNPNSSLRSFRPQIPLKTKTQSIQEHSLQRLLKESNSVILLVSQDNRLLHVYGDSSKIFQPLHGEIVTEITRMVVLPLQLPLNTALHRAKKNNKSVIYNDIRLEQADGNYHISLKVIPPETDGTNGDFYLVQINQEAISLREPAKLTAPYPEVPQVEQEQFKVSNEAQQRILELEQELQYTRENLQALVEELETTNEELHSVNEELHTVNIEYQSKIQELTQLNNDIDNLLKSADIGVVFLDPELRIRKFTPAATEVISLRHTDLERPLKELSLKIDCPQLLELLEEVLENQQSIELEVKLKEHDSYFLMGIHPYQNQTKDQQNQGLVISFVKIDEIKKAQRQLENTLVELENRKGVELQNRQLAAIETTRDGIAILNDDKFIYLNQAHLEIFGYSKPEELIGQSWHVLYEPESIARLEREVFPILMERGQWQGETTAKHRDGHTFDEELTLTFTPKGDLICVCRDISEIKQARQQILQANVELEQRVANRTTTLANFGDCLKQLHRLATTNYEQLEDLFDDYLKSGCQMFNLDTGMVRKNTDGNYTVLAVHSTLNFSVVFEAEFKDTYCAEILVNGNVFGTLEFSDTTSKPREFESYEREIIELMARDIGHSIAAWQSKAALQKSEKRFRSTFEQAAVGVAHVSPEGRFLKVNQRFCNILGYTQAELLQKGFQDITEPEDLAADVEYVKQILAGEINNFSREKRYIHSNGWIVWANLTVALVKRNSGKPEYFIAVVEDISDRKQTEIALEESTIKLQQANRAKDAFIAHVSHELRTPLNSILGFSSILQKDTHLTANQLHSINIIHHSGQHLLTLINDILDFSKIASNNLQLTPENFNLRQFLREIAVIFRLRAQQKGLKFSTQISPSLPIAVNADSTRLRQVLYNLLSNAIKFTKTGSVTLKIDYFEDLGLETSPYLAPTSVKNNSEYSPTPDIPQPTPINKIRFQIEDTGIGIPADKFADVFTPFGQLNSGRGNNEGTGLGLTISQEIIQLMGGSQIQLESQVSQGSKFWFDLELLAVETNLLPALPEFICQAPRRLRVPRKILVIDDNYDNRNLLVNYLQPFGFTLAEANNGQVGLDLAKTFQPDAILVDWLMPVMDGKEMVARLKQQPQFQDCLVIMISAGSQSLLEPLEVDCHEFLSKPVNLEQLMTLLESHLQLDWLSGESTTEPITEPDNSSILVTPPQETLIKLLELAELGDMEEIEQQINSLEALDAQYIPFIKQIRQLAASFQQHQLEIFIKNFIGI